MDDDRDFKNAVDRTWMQLQFMVETKGTTGTVGDVHEFPNAALRDMIVDMMHYAEARNRHNEPGDIFYIDINREFELAKRQFMAEKERIPLAMDPRLEQVLLALEKRQQEERSNLIVRQGEEIPDGGASSPELRDKHKEECEAQEKKFDLERQRYIREYHNGRRIEEELNAEEKVLTQDDPKLSK